MPMLTGYEFEWNEIKAQANVRRHGVSFEEAATVFSDPLAILLPDPDHSQGEERFLVLGMFVPPTGACRQSCGAPAKDAPDQCATSHTTRKRAI